MVWPQSVKLNNVTCEKWSRSFSMDGTYLSLSKIWIVVSYTTRSFYVHFSMSFIFIHDWTLTAFFTPSYGLVPHNEHFGTFSNPLKLIWINSLEGNIYSFILNNPGNVSQHLKINLQQDNLEWLSD